MDTRRYIVFLNALLPLWFLQPAPLWAQDRPNTTISKTETIALLQSLNAELLSNNSATLVLDHWCKIHKMASPSSLIVAERVTDASKVPTPEQRKLLAVGENDVVKYRRVRLKCGDHILSEADNWYVPARLTADMNRQLETSDISFGRAVQALNFRRQTLSSEILLKDGAPEIPPAVLQHRAVLMLPDGTPFSALVETYTRAVLVFPR